MYRKILKVLGEGTANLVQGVLQDAVWGRKARHGRQGAFKAYRPRRTRQPRAYSHRNTSRSHLTVVHVYAGAHIHF